LSCCFNYKHTFTRRKKKKKEAGEGKEVSVFSIIANLPSFLEVVLILLLILSWWLVAETMLVKTCVFFINKLLFCADYIHIKDSFD
jgi:hypothetical protein